MRGISLRGILMSFKTWFGVSKGELILLSLCMGFSLNSLSLNSLSLNSLFLNSLFLNSLSLSFLFFFSSVTIFHIHRINEKKTNPMLNIILNVSINAIYQPIFSCIVLLSTLNRVVIFRNTNITFDIQLYPSIIQCQICILLL